MAKKQIIKNILLAVLWATIGSGTIVLLVAAIQKKDAKQCTGIDISIKGVSTNFFVDKNDILNTITAICNGKPIGKPVGSFDLRAMEIALQKNTWIRNAQLFFDNNETLLVNVLEREPLARVFTTGGTTFYIDSSIAMLPLSEKFSARLPVFTGFPSDKKVLLQVDSNLLRDILTVGMAIHEDSFYMSMIDQVDITPERTFEMVPKFGNTIIAFGDAKNAVEKLQKLQLFYKEIVVKAGWNKYSEINVQYANQVVAKRKGAAEVKADSLRTLQLMKIIAENAERLAEDSLQMITQDNDKNTTNNNIIQESIERDDNSDNSNESSMPAKTNKNENASLAEKSGSDNAQKVPPRVAAPPATSDRAAGGKPSSEVTKPTVKPKPAAAKEPKLVMPKQVPKNPAAAKPINEY